MKKMKWMTGALVVSMVGCNTAQKKEFSFTNPEDRAFQEEAVETFGQRENVSTLMAFYEEEIRTGKLNLNELRRSRSIASVIPAFADLGVALAKQFERDEKGLKAFVSALNEQGRGLKGFKEFKATSAKELEAELKALDDLGLDSRKKIAEGLFGKAGTQKALLAQNKELKAQYTRMAKALDEESKAVINAKKAMSQNNKTSKQIEELLEEKVLKEAAVKKGKRKTFSHPETENKLTSYFAEFQTKIEKTLPAAEAVEVKTNLQATLKNELETFHLTGTYRFSPSKTNNGTCEVLALGVPESKALRELSEIRLKQAREWRNRYPDGNYCPAAGVVPSFEFQVARGRTGKAGLLAVEQLGMFCKGDNTKVAAEAGAMAAAGKTGPSGRFPSCK